MTFFCTKTYDHSEGLSCAFRQWRAQDSHCRWVHGYALAVTFTFAAKLLNDNQWVYDFGSLKHIKAWLHEQFDHRLCIASDDPELDTFKQLAKKDLINLNILPGVGCERFAEYIFNEVSLLVNDDRVWLQRVEVKEHGSNSAIYDKNEH